MKKNITIITTSNFRPDFIKLQKESFDKYINPKYDYIVYDSSDGIDVERECNLLNIEYRKVLNRGDNLSDPSWTVMCILNSIWKEVKDITGYLVIIDSDMFLINNFDINNLMEDSQMMFVPINRENGKIIYPWPGFVVFDMDNLPNKDSVDFAIAEIDGHRLDTGGALTLYLRNNNIKSRHLDMWTVLEKGKYHYNGYYDSVGEIQHIELDDLTKAFPHPTHVDMLGIKDAPLGECFIFHYKSGSNYQPFMNDEYNQKKTTALKELLCKS